MPVRNSDDGVRLVLDLHSILDLEYSRDSLIPSPGIQNAYIIEEKS